jgi:hypothetical protein
MQNNNLKKVIWIIVVIIAIVIVAIAIMMVVGQKGKSVKQSTITQTAKQQTITQKGNSVYNAITEATTTSAGQNQIVKGFPSGLADTTSISIQSSYHTAGKGYDQYTVVLNTTQSVSMAFDEYVNKLSANPYTIKSKQAATTKIVIASIFATEGTNDIAITISPDSTNPKTNDLMITYDVPNSATAMTPPSK